MKNFTAILVVCLFKSTADLQRTHSPGQQPIHCPRPLMLQFQTPTGCFAADNSSARLPVLLPSVATTLLLQQPWTHYLPHTSLTKCTQEYHWCISLPAAQAAPTCMSASSSTRMHAFAPTANSAATCQTDMGPSSGHCRHCHRWVTKQLLQSLQEHEAASAAQAGCDFNWHEPEAPTWDVWHLWAVSCSVHSTGHATSSHLWCLPQPPSAHLLPARLQFCTAKPPVHVSLDTLYPAWQGSAEHSPVQMPAAVHSAGPSLASSNNHQGYNSCKP